MFFYYFHNTSLNLLFLFSIFVFTNWKQRKKMTDYPQLLVYKASAGSGKTFTLAVQYIKQLIEDTHAYRRILAVTFTNKATAEMKKRILEQLFGLANGLKSSDSYLEELLKITSKNEAEIRRAAREALTNIIHDYSRFRIETIDSFFQSVMRNLARELELGANMSIELNNADVLSDAVDAMIEKLDRRSPVLYWLLEYIEERIADDKRWNVSNEIKGFGRNIFDEGYVEKGAGLRKKLADSQFIPTYRKQLQDIRTEALEEMKGFNEQFLGVLEVNGLTPADLKNGSRGIGSYFNKIGNGYLGSDVRNATVEKCLESEENWTTKTSAYRDTIRSLAANELIPLLKTAEDFRPKNNILVNSCDLSLRYLNNLRLLANIDEEVRLQNQLHNRFLLSDTNALLHGLIREGDASFVYEKIGTTIDTVMIDEFQDTSRMQWLNIRPLLNESMANDSDSLIIGDEKQCIYRFRDSDPTLLQCQVQQQFPGRTTVTGDTPSANTNWRSAPNVVEFNNALFGALSSAVGVDDIYANVCQQIPDRGSEYPGYVSLMPVSAPSKDKFEEFALKRMTDEMERQLRQGYKYNELCVLVRQRSDGIRVIARLMEIADTAGLPDCEYPLLSEANVISDDAMMLAQAPVIKVIMSVLRAFANPSLSFRDGNEGEATAAKFHSRAEMVEILNRFDHFSSLGHSPEDALQLALSSEECNWNMQSEMPEMECFNLPSLVEHIIQHRISPRDRKAQNMYIAAFQDLVCDYCATSTPDVGGFVKWWDLSSHRFTVSAPMDAKAIRVMTIHKAKGLEFKCTHIPFLAYKVPKFDGHQWFVSQPLPGIDENIMPPLLPIVPGSFLKNTVFAPQLDRLVYEQLLDELNVLYVAFTRAGQELIANYWANSSGTIGELLASANDSMAQYAGAVPGEFVSGTPDTVPVRKEEQKTALDPHDSMPMRPYEVYDGTTVWNQTQVDFDPDRVEAVTRGTALHNLLALVKDAESVPMAVEKAVRRHIITRAESEPVKVLLMERIGNEKTKHWFSGFKRVLRERQITTDKGEHYRPDRVVWTADGHIDIIDYKFGAERSAAYARQLRNYVRLFAEMGYDNLRAFVWYVDSDHIVPVGF